MRYAKRTDANHSDVVNGLKAALPAASVLDLSGTGKGCPDIAVGWEGYTFLFEIKDGKKSPSKRDLTDAQKKFHSTWQGHADVVVSAAEITAKIAQWIHAKK